MGTSWKVIRIAGSVIVFLINQKDYEHTDEVQKFWLGGWGRIRIASCVSRIAEDDIKGWILCPLCLR